MSLEDPPVNLTVIIATRNRADSLRVALECLASANRDGIRTEIIVVDNAGRDHTKQVVDSFSQRIPIRYLYEPKLGTFGKSHALNCALDAGSLGEIIAVLDDDMSPDLGWFQGIKAVCERWPDKDLFTGRTFIIWPFENVPGWAGKKGNLQSMLLADQDFGKSDTELKDGRWYLGGHFWFRSRVLARGRRFKDIWVTEPDFQLDLVEEGCGGVATPNVISGHRIQPSLLQKDIALNRARKTGASCAWLRLEPYREKVKQARLLHHHPWLGRLFCLANHLRWRLLYLLSFLYPSDSTRFSKKWTAVERMTTYIELFRAANQLDGYSLWRGSSKTPRKPSSLCMTAATRSKQ
jgi:glycosyltransferase involved in cell wall biosynthesis